MDWMIDHIDRDADGPRSRGKMRTFRIVLTSANCHRRTDEIFSIPFPAVDYDRPTRCFRRNRDQFIRWIRCNYIDAGAGGRKQLGFPSRRGGITSDVLRVPERSEDGTGFPFVVGGFESECDYFSYPALNTHRFDSDFVS
jgi:hypothetical protein